MAVERERRHQKHRQMIMAMYEGICHICSEPYADAIDHVVPVAKGGSDHPDNLRPAHTSCNSRKGARAYPKWAENNPNMWEPDHLPEDTRRRMAAEQQQKDREREAKRQSAIERYERLSAAWSEKKKTLESLEREKPQKPQLAKPEDVGPWVGLAAAALLVLYILIFNDQRSPFGTFVAMAFFGFLTFVVVALLGALVWEFLQPLILSTVRRDRTRAYEERLSAWQALVEQWQAKEPTYEPTHPDKEFDYIGMRESQKSTLYRKPRKRR